MQGQGISACMHHTNQAVKRIRMGTLERMQSITENLRHQRMHIHDSAKGLMETCSLYAAAVKDARKADKNVTAALNRQATAQQQANSTLSQILKDRDCDICDYGNNGPEF